jgi:MarR family transcriptional regulator for hemolysin
MPTIQEHFSSSLHHSARAWRLALDRRLKHLGLGQAGWMTIAMAAKAKEPLSQTDLAHALGVEGATMVLMIDRLVKANLVKRQPSISDRRIKYIVLTDEGRALHGKVKAEADAFRTEMLSQEDEILLSKTTELLERLRVAAENMK